MSITDELREWSKNWSDTNRSLDDIADRIDEAHKAAKLHEINKAYDAIADTYIALPKDKNGKPILIDDKVYMGGEAAYVCGIAATRVFVFDNANGNTKPWLARFCEPESADSLDIENGWDVERIVAKMLADNDNCIDFCKKCREAMDRVSSD